jgi:hypothetical protein
MNRFISFSERAAKQINKHPMLRDASKYASEAVSYILDSYQASVKNDNQIQNDQQKTNKEQPLLLESGLNKNNNKTDNKENSVIDYRFVLEGPPLNQKVSYTESKNDNSKARIDELREDRQKFDELTKDRMSLFADPKVSKEQKDLFNSFTKEIIKEQRLQEKKQADKLIQSRKSDTNNIER